MAEDSREQLQGIVRMSNTERAAAETSMGRLRAMVDGTDTRAGRLFDYCVLGLIALSIVSLTVETLPGLPQWMVSALGVSEVVITVLFTLEYGLRVAIARRRLAYMTSFFGIVDLVAIVPFYLALGLDLRAVRAFRLFRIVRLLKLVRYGQALSRFAKALTLAREEVVLFLVATSMLLYLAAVGIYYFEHEAQPEAFPSIPHSLWWAVTTLSTVGYGDIYPVTTGGKIFTFGILMIGLGIVAVPAGLVATSLAEVRKREDARREDLAAGNQAVEGAGTDGVAARDGDADEPGVDGPGQ